MYIALRTLLKDWWRKLTTKQAMPEAVEATLSAANSAEGMVAGETVLEDIIVSSRILLKRNVLAVPQIKGNWSGAEPLQAIRHAASSPDPTPPEVALPLIEAVLERLARLSLVCSGLPEASGNEVRWRLQAPCGPTIELCFQFKQGAILAFLWGAAAGPPGPREIRGRPVDPRIPQEAPAGYPADDPERTRGALTFVLRGKKPHFERRELMLLDTWRFYNLSEMAINEVVANPHDVDFGWLARSVDCPHVAYQPGQWRERALTYFQALRTEGGPVWEAFRARPFLELIERTKVKTFSRHTRLFLGFGFREKSEVCVRAVLQWRRRGGAHAWPLVTLEGILLYPGWLEDLLDVLIVWVHDALRLFGQGFDVRYKNMPKLDQQQTRYDLVWEQPWAKKLKQNGHEGEGRDYEHSQLWVLPEDVEQAPAALKQGVLAGCGGTWTLDPKFGWPAKPETGLYNGPNGWHSGKDGAAMEAANAIIRPRVNEWDEKSPDMDAVRTAPRAPKGSGVSALTRSWYNGSWVRRKEKVLGSRPYAEGFKFREPLRAEAIGVRVEVYWPGKPTSSWGSVVEYDEESEYYTVLFDEDGARVDYVWIEIMSYKRDAKRVKSGEQLAEGRRLKRARMTKEQEEKFKEKRRDKTRRRNQRKKEMARSN